MSATHPDQSFDTPQSFATNRSVGTAQSFRTARSVGTDQSFDSGENHLKPALVAILIAAVTTVVSLAIIGLPH